MAEALVMSGSTGSGPGPNCEIDVMGQNRPLALQKNWAKARHEALAAIGSP
jgi:hypothetical protein